MGKIRNTINMVKLKDYVGKHEITIHKDYLYLRQTMLKTPKLESTAIRQCCISRPICVIPEGRKRIVVNNYMCYAHASEAIQRGLADISVWIVELKKVEAADVFMNIFLNSLSPCPLMNLKPTYRSQIIALAFKKKGDLKNSFDVSSLSSFCTSFGISPCMMTRFNDLDPKEQDRLSFGAYKCRNKLQTEGVASGQAHCPPQSSDKKKGEKTIELAPIKQEEPCPPQANVPKKGKKIIERKAIDQKELF